MNQQKQEELTFRELLIFNSLISLPKGERITTKSLSLRTGIHVRDCYAILENMRTQGYRIISSKKQNDLGHRFALNEEEFRAYTAWRIKDISANLKSIKTMKKGEGYYYEDFI